MNGLIPGAERMPYNPTDMLQPAGPVDQLRQRKSMMEAELAKVNAALEALDKNPEIADILQLVGKALR
jgi:chaperonin cofactor prefoldin